MPIQSSPGNVVLKSVEDDRDPHGRKLAVQQWLSTSQVHAQNVKYPKQQDRNNMIYISSLASFFIEILKTTTFLFLGIL